MRFNHPAEAKQLKSGLPTSHIPMAPISFSNAEALNSGQLERKPPVAPRKSPRNSCSDDEVGFIGKLTKFEMLARQGRSNCVSPKVFPSGSLTTNVPADQILGHSRSSSLVSLARSSPSSPFQNLTNLERIQHNEEHKQITGLPNHNAVSNTAHYQNTTQHRNQVQTASKGWRIHQASDNDENRNMLPNNCDMLSRSMICQGSCEMSPFGRDFDMSQSLIVAKTTTCTEFLQLENFGSNPILPSHRRPGSYGNEHRGFGSHPNIRRLQPPSPAFNRDPKYSEQKAIYDRVKSPTPSTGSGCSLEELRERQLDAENKRREAENRRKQAQDERVREQEQEKQEKMRLEEILAMCAEYERQSNVDKPRQPNRSVVLSYYQRPLPT